MPQNTYVTSINGLTGDPSYEIDRFDHNGEPVYGIAPHRHHALVLDSSDIHLSGSTGPTSGQTLPTIASTMRPLILEQMGESDDYLMRLGAGIPFSASGG